MEFVLKVKNVAFIYEYKYRPLYQPPNSRIDFVKWDLNLPTKIVDTIFDSDEFFDYNLKIHNGLINGLMLLKQRGYELILYSKGSMRNLGNKIHWVEQWLNFFNGWVLAGSNDLKMKKIN